MNYTLFIELLYVGICFEKGRVYTNYWKPWYRKKLKSQVVIWKKLIYIIDKPNLEKEDLNIMEDIAYICKKYKLKHYDMYTSNIEYDSINNTLINSFSIRQKEIIKFIIELLEDLQKKIVGFSGKEDISFILRILHNLPLALFCKSELINNAHRVLSCDDAKKYAFSNMSEEMKTKYKKYNN